MGVGRIFGVWKLYLGGLGDFRFCGFTDLGFGEFWNFGNLAFRKFWIPGFIGFSDLVFLGSLDLRGWGFLRFGDSVSFLVLGF